MIEQDGIDAFTLRECARRAGVSHGAPAHHFTDRTGLLTALAVQALEQRVAAAEARMVAAGPDPLDRLKACGLAISNSTSAIRGSTICARTTA